MLRYIAVALTGVLWLCAACGSRIVHGAAVGPPTSSTSASPVASARNAYDPSRDALADIESALARAASDHKAVLLDFGADWCPECRVLHKLFESPDIAELITKNYHLVLVDIGDFDHNMDLANKYIDLSATGIPALVVLSPDGKVRIGADVNDFTDDESNANALREFLTQWAPR